LVEGVAAVTASWIELLSLLAVGHSLVGGDLPGRVTLDHIQSHVFSIRRFVFSSKGYLSGVRGSVRIASLNSGQLSHHQDPHSHASHALLLYVLLTMPALRMCGKITSWGLAKLIPAGSSTDSKLLIPPKLYLLSSLTVPVCR
jgi:hypothetical protein